MLSVLGFDQESAWYAPYKGALVLRWLIFSWELLLRIGAIIILEIKTFGVIVKSMFWCFSVLHDLDHGLWHNFLKFETHRSPLQWVNTHNCSYAPFPANNKSYHFFIFSYAITMTAAWGLMISLSISARALMLYCLTFCKNQWWDSRMAYTFAKLALH